jgi:hypothetical protein
MRNTADETGGKPIKKNKTGGKPRKIIGILIEITLIMSS